MKKEVYLLILILFAFLKEVNGIAISPAKYEFDFIPYLTQDLEVIVINTANHPINATLSFKGDLARYITHNISIVELNASGISKQRFVLKLPGKIDTPGEITISITAGEIIPETAGISIGTAVESHIQINVPYPEKYVAITFTAENANENEPANFLVRIKNKGIEKVNNLIAYLEILDDLKVIKKFKSNNYTLELNEGKDINFQLITSGLSPGNYLGKAYIIYDGITSKESMQEFKIGTQKVELKNYTSTLLFNQISKVLFSIASKWNSRIDKIYGNLILKKEGKQIQQVKTEESAVEPWGTVDLNTYIDASKLEPGVYQFELTLFYADKIQKFELPVTIEEPIQQIRKQPLNKILLIIIILIIILDIVWIFRRKRKEKKEISEIKDDLDF
ncbi:MAG: hypothetical protein AABY07_08690 [Nanoarchaeota archaeon]